MSEALNANVVLRHFTGRPPEMAARATAALVEAAPRSLVLTDLTVAEVVYVLQGPYALPRGEVARIIEATLSFLSVAVDNDALLRRTVDHYEQRNMDWPDAHLVALVELRHLDGLLSFDRFDSKTAGLSVVRREPWAGGRLAGVPAQPQECRTGDLPAVTVAPPSRSRGDHRAGGFPPVTFSRTTASP